MRNYALHQFVSNQMTFSGSPIARVVANVRSRREARRLANYDDFMLRDIGLTRGDVMRAASMPLWSDQISFGR
jgi:uncharacterized protein YjiS (DUF1127 family)